MVTSSLYVIGAIATALATLAAMLLSPKPCGVAGHLQSFARLGIFGGALFAAFRVFSEGSQPAPERAVLMVALALLYCVQAWIDIQRQRTGGCGR